MAKISTVYTCRNCGFTSAKWMGKCTSCNEWNTFDEEVMQKKKLPLVGNFKEGKNPVQLKDVKKISDSRIGTGMAEMDRVLGGGVIAGSAVLIGGEPGIGKSTLLLQAAMGYGQQNILYISGEESEEQIKLRAERLQQNQRDDLFVITESDIHRIVHFIETGNYRFIVIDSVQTLFNPDMESAPGSVSQVRECSYKLIEKCKHLNIPLFLIGHVNKEGSIAGPKVLEHLVDTVLQFEGDRNHLYRIVRTIKNRFGNTSEIGVFEMKNYGLEEVLTPSQFFLNNTGNKDISGSVITTILEGNRAFILELQALVSSAVYGVPQRVCNGFDNRRLNLLLAVLEKKCGFRLGQKDVFMNMTGGLRTNDPAVDLAVCLAVLSSNEDLSIPYEYCIIGEVGLGGEVRPVMALENRMKESVKMGFKKMIIPASQFKRENLIPEIEIIPVKSVTDALKELFG